MTKLLDSIGHWVIILAVIGSATYLAAVKVIPGDAITTVYGVALGFTGTSVAIGKSRSTAPEAAPTKIVTPPKIGE